MYTISISPLKEKKEDILLILIFIDTHLDGIKVFDSKTNKGPTEFKAQHTPIVGLQAFSTTSIRLKPKPHRPSPSGGLTVQGPSYATGSVTTQRPYNAARPSPFQAHILAVTQSDKSPYNCITFLSPSTFKPPPACISSYIPHSLVILHSLHLLLLCSLQIIWIFTFHLFFQLLIEFFFIFIYLLQVAMSAFGAAATANTNPNKSIEVIPFHQMFSSTVFST